MSGIDSGILDEFVQAVGDKAKSVQPPEKADPRPAQVVAKDVDGTIWVREIGGTTQTPVKLYSAEHAVGDLVQVQTSNGVSSILGNFTDPSASGSKVVETVERVITVENDLLADKARIGDLEATSATITQLNAVNADIDNLKAKDAEFDKAIAKKLEADDLTAINADITNLKAKDAEFDTAIAKKLEAGDLKAVNADIANLKSSKADVADLTAETVRVDNLLADKADVTELDAAKGRISDLEADHVSAADLEAEKARVGTLLADYTKTAELDATYAKIDLANVTNAWIEGGVIKDAAISDAQIIGVSANKLTAGTIDAAKVNVTNLNAKNIKVERINGVSVTGKSVADALAAAESEIDGVQSDVSALDSKLDTAVDALNGRIDAQIETFTAKAVPTLSNYPASSWTTDKLKSEHVGDICYVVNAGAADDGYTYRFAYDETSKSYGWVLIKDNQVTAALQRLQDAEGNISGLQDFQVETASWIEETDEGISSLKTRSTQLEADMGTKVSTSAFNEVKQMVDENSTTITSLGERVDSKADGSTVTELSNTVNTVKQTASENSSKISSLTTTVDGQGERLTSAESKITQHDNAIALRATKTEAYQAAQPNLVPWFSISVSDTTYWASLHARNGSISNAEGLHAIYDGQDGWAHVTLDSRTSAGNNGSSNCYMNMFLAKGQLSPHVKANANYTWLVEVRNLDWVGASTSSRLIVTPSVNNATADLFTSMPSSSDAPNGGRFTTDGSAWGVVTSHASFDSNTQDTRGYCYIPTGCYADFDLRISLYEGEYTGPYKPYSGSQLYASQAELKVANDAISSKVEKNGVISSINQSSESVTINANRVNIEGAAIFTGSGRLSSASLDGKYDANGAASAAKDSLVDDLASASGTTVINGGHITTGSIAIGKLDADAKAAVDNAAKTATNYISADSSGIRIANSNPASATTYQHQTATETEYFVDGVSMLKVGADGQRIGKAYVSGASDNESHTELDYHSMQLIDNEGHTYFHVSDLRDRDGKTTIELVFVGDGTTKSYDLPLSMTSAPEKLYFVDFLTGDGTTKSFALSAPPSSGIEVTVNGTADSSWTLSDQNAVTSASAPANGASVIVDYQTTAFTLYKKLYDADLYAVVLDKAPLDGSTFRIKYETDSPLAKAFTLGRRFGVDNTRMNLGPYSVAEGYMVEASGAFSHGEGHFTNAYGSYSHVEGKESTASGYASHAEGETTSADKRASHAEGSNTHARGVGAHAEGVSTNASGNESHAEGGNTYASGMSAHAEGHNTYARGMSAHAEGRTTYANGDMSHAEGFVTAADGDYSHAEGLHTEATGRSSHAEGVYTIAQGNHQHAMGIYNAPDTTSLLLIGNGKGEDADSRSNALAVDVDGTFTRRSTASAPTRDTATSANTRIIGNYYNDAANAGIGYDAIQRDASGVYRSYAVTGKDAKTLALYLRVNDNGGTSATLSSGTWAEAAIPHTFSDNSMCFKSTNLTRGTAVSEMVSGPGILLVDKDGGWAGRLVSRFLTGRREGLQLEARSSQASPTYNALGLYVDSSGNRTVVVSESAPWRNALGASGGVWPVTLGGTGAAGTVTTTATASILTAGSGVTINSARYSQWGKVATLFVSLKRSTNIGSGDIANIVLGTLVSGKRPATAAPFQLAGTGPMMQGNITTGGDITLAATGGAVAAGTVFTICSTFVVA